MAKKDCLGELKKGLPDIHKYLEDKNGAFDGTDKSKADWIKSAQELQDHSLKTLNDVYAKVGVPGFEKSTSKEVNPLIQTAIDNAGDVKAKIYQNVLKSGNAQDISDVLKEVSDQWHDEGTRAQTERDFGKPIVDAAKEMFPQKSDKSLVPENKDEIKISELIDKPITYKGEKATLFQDGQTIVAKIDGKNKEYELGNFNEIKDHPISDYGISQETSVVSVNDAGNILVRNDEFKNSYSNPLAAINLDENGNVVSVNLETADGKKRTFRGNIAEDIAYQIHLKEINKNNETRNSFEKFINTDEPTVKEINDAGISATATQDAAKNNAEISREKAQPIKNKEQYNATKNNDGTVTIHTNKTIVVFPNIEKAEKFAVKGNATLNYVDKIETNSENKIPENNVTSQPNSLKEILNNHENSATESFPDLVNSVEQFAKEKGNDKMLSAVDKFRREQEQDNKLSGRGDMDAAEKEFQKSLNDEINKEATIENKPTDKQTEATQPNNETAGTTTQATEKVNESGVVNEPPPPETPQEEAANASGNLNEWTRVNRGSLNKVKDLFRKVGISWDVRKDAAMESLQAKSNPGETLVHTAVRELDNFYKQLRNKQTPRFNTDDQVAMHFLKISTEQQLAKLSKEANENADFSDINSIGADVLTDQLDRVNAVLGAMRSESGVGLGYGTVEARLHPDYGFEVRQMQMIRANGGEPLNAEQESFIKEQWAKEKELMQREQALKEQGMKENFDAQLSEIQKQYEEKLKNSKATISEKTKEKTLSQSGKELADRLRKLKIQKGQTALDVTFGLRNLAVELVAQLVEKGAKLGDAIREALKDDRFKTIKEEYLTSHIIEGLNKKTPEETLDAIKQYVKDNGITDLTNEMVATSLISDFVNSHINEVEQKDILNTTTERLREILPDITKENLIEAYLKEGEFKQPTKKDLEGGIAEAKKQLTSIAKLEEDINDLNGLKDLRQRNFSTPREKSEYEQNLADQKSSLIKEQKDRRNQILKDNKSIETEAQRQFKKVAELTDKRNKLESGIREKKSKNVGKPDTPEIEGLKKQVEQADKNLREAESKAKEIQRDAQNRADKLGELNANIKRAENNQELIKTYRTKSDKEIDAEIDTKNKELKKAIKDNTSGDRVQSKLLQNAKEKAIKDKAEFKRKLDAGEFETMAQKRPVRLNKADAELIQLDKERAKIESAYRKEQRKFQEHHKSALERAADTFRSLWVMYLIGHPKTLAKIAWMSAIRPTSEAVSKLTFGQAFHLFDSTIYNRAKAGGESSSIRTIEKMASAYFNQYGAEKLQKVFADGEKKYLEALQKYNDYKASENPSSKKLAQLKKDSDNKMFSSIGNLMYNFIGGSSIQDAFTALVHRSNNIEKQFGKVGEESFSDGNWLDKVNYVAGFVGRSHSAAKTFSGRASFAAGFMARVEDAISKGEETNANKILEIAHESYLDWERGKYQQSNWISDKWNQIVNNIEDKYGKQDPRFNKYDRGLKQVLKTDVAITRVPVNIIHEEVAEYLLGAFRAPVLAMREYRKANKQTLSEYTDRITEENQYEVTHSPEFKERVKEIVSGMDADQAARIVRMFRKGGLGIGLYAAALIWGGIHFGIFPHKGQPKKKEEDKLKPGELNPGEVMFGNTRMGGVMSGMIEHTPALWDTFMGLGLAKIYNDDIHKKGKHKKTEVMAAADAIVTHLKIIEGNIPQTKIISPTQTLQDIGTSLKKTFTNWGLIDNNKK